MQWWQALVCALVGGAIGAAAAWLLARAHAGAPDAERAALGERIAARDAQLAETVARGGIAAAERDSARAEAGAATAARAAAEAAMRGLAERVAALDAAAVERERALARTAEEASGARARIAELEARLADEKRAAGEKMALVEDAQRKLEQAFKALSSDALKSNNQAFIELAQATLARFQEGAKGDLELRNRAIEALVKPLAETVGKLDGKLGLLEQARATASGSLDMQLKQLQESQALLGKETRNLVEALRRPHTRGRWGETQLRRVVEMSGMLEHCDFVEQVVAEGDSRLRPDLVVRLPGGKSIVVDAKAALSAYLEALEAPDEDRRRDRLKAHARHLVEHVDGLAAKAYWEQFQPSPEFVVLFIPGDGILAAALEHDPALWENAIRSKVLLATPTSLIGLLRSIAFGWRQEQLQRNSAEISALGKELYKRIGDLASHFANLRKHLDHAVESYNKAVGSLEGRVLPQARRFKELGADDGREIEDLVGLDSAPRGLAAPELLAPAAEPPPADDAKPAA